MQGVDIIAIRAQAAQAGERVIASGNLDILIVGALLAVVIVMTLSTIWKNRTRVEAPLPKLSSTSGFTRWLTPMGMKSIPAEQGVAAARPRRKSGAQRTIKVSTPVSKVPQRALKVGASPLEIARRSGLARDAVVMMMANAAPKPVVKKPTPAKVAAATQAPTRTESTDRAMSAPGAYTAAQRVIPERTANRGVIGSRFSARLS